MPRILACLFVLCLNAVSSTIAVGQTVVANSDGDSLDKDYSAELPRLPPRTADEALASFEVLDGFEVQLVAAEPLVADPVAFAFDARGRLFVVEMRDYSEQETEHLGRIALLTDRDGDGVMDQRSTFAAGLSWPTAVWPWRDGVLVAEPPRLTWYRDSDDDGVSEHSQDWYVGFGRGNVQGLVNSLRWGVDGNIHGATSSAGATLEPVGSTSAEINLGRRDFAIDPLTKLLQPESGGGQHGMSFNRWGDKFVTSNSDHLQQVINLDDWLSRHPSEVTVPATRRSIAEDGPQAEVFRVSPIEPWRIVRTRLRVSGVAPGIVEGGGRAAGYFTGATGTWLVDEEFGFGDGSDTALVCDVGSNLIHRKRMVDHGLFWSGQRIDVGTELLRSSDTWFRPVQLGDGPDGAIYIADMAREVIEHPKSLPPMIKQHLDLTSGRDLGRIWKLTRTKQELEPQPRNLTTLSSNELARHLGHKIAWQRRMASQLLVERSDETVRPTLLEMCSSPQVSAEARILSMHIAERLGWFDESFAKAVLRDEHERVLEHAIQLIEKLGLTAAFSDELLRIASQAKSPRVQLALARASADLDSDVRFAVLRPLLPLAQDELVRAVIATAADKESWKLVQDIQGPNRASWLSLLLPVWTKQIGTETLDDWLLQELRVDNPQLATWLDSLCSLPNRNAAAAVLAVLSDEDRNSLFEQIEIQLSPDAQPNQLEWIGLLPEISQARWLTEGLAPNAPEIIQQAVIGGLAWANHPELAQELTERFTSFTPSVQNSALRFLTSRSAAVELLADAIEQKQILARQLPADVRQRLLSDRNPELSKRFRECLSEVSQDRENLIARYAEVMPDHTNISAANFESGRLVFERVCAQCHRLGGVGNDVGPPLKSLIDKSPAQLLEAILDPNREVDPKFMSYSVLTDDGRVVAGIVREESSTQLVIAEAGGKLHRILRKDITELKSNGMSFMPVGLEEQVAPEQIAELVAFLRSGGIAPQ